MGKQYFKDFSIGDSDEPSYGRTVTESDLHACAGIEGSFSELHFNHEKTGESGWENPVAQGVLLLVMMQGMAQYASWELKPIALYGFDDIRFINPVFVGDTLSIELEVVDKEVKDNESGILTMKENLYKDDGSLAVTRKRLYLFRREASEQEIDYPGPEEGSKR